MNKRVEKREKKFDIQLKINIISKKNKITAQFLRAISANLLFKESFIMTTGATFATLNYQKGEKYKFQFWLIDTQPRFEILLHNYTLGSSITIYFYQINEKIEEHRLKLIKNGINHEIPIIFVGYESSLPSNPEKTDMNIPIIQKYFDEFTSLYVSVDNPDSMFQILDRIIDSYLIKMSKLFPELEKNNS